MPMGWNSIVEAAAADIPLQQGIRGSSSSGSVGGRKGPWTPEEDKLLSDYMSVHVEGKWSSVANSSGLNRSAKSCRLRWVNYLRPGLKRGQLTPQEEGIIIELHALWGNKWSTIARYLPGRTDNEIKNYWRTHFKKKDTTASKSSLLTKSFKQKQVRQQQQQQQLPEDVEEEEEEDDVDEVPISRKDATAPAHTSVTNNHHMTCMNQEYDINTFSYQPPFELDDQVMYDRYAAATWTYDHLQQPEERHVELWTGLWDLDDNSPPSTT